MQLIFVSVKYRENCDLVLRIKMLNPTFLHERSILETKTLKYIVLNFDLTLFL